MIATRLDDLRERLEPLRSALLDHPVYGHLDGAEGLRLFMRSHAFAVWDFMSLLKALQRQVCCVGVPWVPPADASACRLINEIVTAEESDEDGRGGHASHFDLYLSAMDDLGADRRPIDAFVSAIRAGRSVREALEASVAPAHVIPFVEQTFRMIAAGDPGSIASAFTFGREDLLPEVFERLLDRIDPSAEGPARGLRYYLDRHIALDADEHGPMAWKLVERLCGEDPENWRRAEVAAAESLKARIALWDGIRAEIDSGASTGERY